MIIIENMSLDFLSEQLPSQVPEQPQQTDINTELEPIKKVVLAHSLLKLRDSLSSISTDNLQPVITIIDHVIDNIQTLSYNTLLNISKNILLAATNSLGNASDNLNSSK